MIINKIKTIQFYVRNHLFRLFIQKLLFKERNYYKIIYPFKAKTVKLQIFINLFEYKVFDFHFCNIEDSFVLYLDPHWIFKDKYRVQFVVDGYITCDGRYPLIEFNDGNYYNVIDFSTFDNELKKNNISSLTLNQSTMITDDENESLSLR